MKKIDFDTANLTYIKDVGEIHCFYLDLSTDEAIMVNMDTFEIAMTVDSSGNIRNGDGDYLATMGLVFSKTPGGPDMWKIVDSVDDIGMGHPGFPDSDFNRGRSKLEPTFATEIQFFKTWKQLQGEYI